MLPFDFNILVIIFACLMLWLILLGAEIGKRLGWLHGETARKSIHIVSGVFLACLPLFASRKEIVIINGLFFLGVVVLVGVLHRFSAIEAIKRWTWGHFLYPISVLLVALIFEDPAIYSFSVLILAFADGLAALIGKRFGKVHYHILGADKTIIGSLTFFLVSLTLLMIYLFSYGDVDKYSIAIAFGGAIMLMTVEGSIASGFDNLFIPGLAAVVLTAL